jgi:hypothetical protein
MNKRWRKSGMSRKTKILVTRGEMKRTRLSCESGGELRVGLKGKFRERKSR